MTETMTMSDVDPARLPPVTAGVIPMIVPSDAAAAIEFYKVAFGAEELARMYTDGEPKLIMHAHLRINGGSLMLNDAMPEHGHPHRQPQGFSLHLQVEDPQAAWDKAVAAGCTVFMPMQVMFWGDRFGMLNDPYGTVWSIGGKP